MLAYACRILQACMHAMPMHAHTYYAVVHAYMRIACVRLSNVHAESVLPLCVWLACCMHAWGERANGTCAREWVRHVCAQVQLVCNMRMTWVWCACSVLAMSMRLCAACMLDSWGMCMRCLRVLYVWDTYEVESKSKLNISIKRQWLELEKCLFPSFYQGSHRWSERTCSSIHTSAKMCLANSSLVIVCRTPTQLVSKLSWDSERPASSDFTLGKRKKFIGVISSE